MKFESFEAQDTLKVGVLLGCMAKKGNIYTLSGDLGVGKTVLAQGFAQGLGIEENINSPTFTIVQEYTNGEMHFFHFDVYRISDPEEMYEIGFEEYLYGGGVCLIEWAELIRDILPENTIDIRIEKDLEKGFDYRKITVKGDWQ